MLKDDSSNRSGNDRFEGFLMDLLNALADKLHVNFEVELQADGRYGSRDESGEWTGTQATGCPKNRINLASLFWDTLSTTV